MKPHAYTFLLLLLLALHRAGAQVPQVISYQGALTDTSGIPRPDGDYHFTFRLYADSSGGTPLWTGERIVHVRRGLFSTYLGGTPGFATLFTGPLWLSVQIESDPEILQRIPLMATAYSFRAIRSDTAQVALTAPNQQVVDSARIAGTVPNNSISNSKLAPDAVSSDKIIDGTIQRVDVAATFKSPSADTADFVRNLPPIDSARIAGTVPDGAITNAKLAANAVTTDKILDGTILTADVAPTFKAPDAAIADTVRRAPPTVIPPGSVDSTKLALNAVVESRIHDGAVTSSKIAGGAVDSSKLASNAVTTVNVLDGTILFHDIGQNGAAVGQVMKWTGTTWAARSDSIGAPGVTSVAAGAGLIASPNPITSIGTISIAPSGVTNAHLDNSAVDSAKIAPNAVSTVHIANGAITNAKLGVNAINTTNITDGTILFQDIGQNGAAIGQVMKWTGTAWAPRNDSLGAGGVGGTGASGQVAFWSSSTNLSGNNGFFWDNTNARLGLGTASPYTQLTLTNTLGFTNGTTPLAYIYQSGTTNPRRTVFAHSPLFPQWGMAYNDLTDQMIFQQDSLNPVMALGIGSKSVGINTAMPEGVLDIRGGAQGIIVQNTSGTNSEDIAIKRPGAVSPSNIRFGLSQRSTNTDLWLYGFDGENFRGFIGFDYSANSVRVPAGGTTLNIQIDSGRVGIGTGAPTAALDVAGNVRVRNMPVLTGPPPTYYDVSAFLDGTFFVMLVIPEPADPTNVRPVDNPSRVLQLSPVKFTSGRSDREDVGLIADDIQSIVPELLGPQTKAHPNGIKYEKISLYLLEVVKEQRQQLSALAARIQRLEQQLQSLSSERTK